jgi:hypothetical protein
MKMLVVLVAIAWSINPVAAKEKLSAQETAVCRSDAISKCFFSLGSAEGTRSCLRKNIAVLSPKCKALVEAKMKAK